MDVMSVVGDGDAAATVRAALAFIDECDAALEFTASAGSGASGKPRNASRDRRTDAVRALRAEAAELEWRLARMRAFERQRVAPSAAAGQEERDLRVVWRGIARRHRKLREEAESEGGRLREAVGRHLRTIRQMRKMLVRQTQQDNALVMRQRLPHVLNGPAPPESTVNELLGALSAILSSKEQRGQLTSLDRASSPTLTRLVLSESCYIPFDAHAAAQALWKRGDQECFIHRVHFKKLMHTPDATLFRSHTARQNFEGLVAKMSGHQAARKRVDGRQVAIAYACTDTISDIGDRHEVSGIAVHERGRIVLSPAGRSLTLLQVNWETIVEVSLGVPDRNDLRKTLVDLMTRSRSNYLSGVQLQIEEDLLGNGRCVSC